MPSIAGPPIIALRPPRYGSSWRRMSRGNLLIDAAVLLEGEVAADDKIVRLVPDAPVPVLHRLPAPLLDAAPDHLRAAGDEVLMLRGSS